MECTTSFGSSMGWLPLQSHSVMRYRIEFIEVRANSQQLSISANLARIVKASIVTVLAESYLEQPMRVAGSRTISAEWTIPQV